MNCLCCGKPLNTSAVSNQWHKKCMLRVTFIDRTGEAEYTILFEFSGGQLSYTAYENLALQIEAAASVQPEDSSTPEPTTAVVPSGQEVTPPETYEVQTEIESVPTQNEDPTETEVSTAVKEPYSERYDFAKAVTGLIVI